MTIPAAPEVDPAPATGCGIVVNVTHRCGKPPVARFTREYAAGEQVLLCEDHRRQHPETFTWNDDEGNPQTYPTTEPVR